VYICKSLYVSYASVQTAMGKCMEVPSVCVTAVGMGKHLLYNLKQKDDSKGIL